MELLGVTTVPAVQRISDLYPQYVKHDLKKLKVQTIKDLAFNRRLELQRVPALHAYWDLEKTVLHETCVSGTVLWSPTNANSPTYTYISQKPW